MKKSILMLSVLCLLIVASCKKDKKTDDQVAECLLTESSYVDEASGENETILYSYDADGRVIGMKFKKGGVIENDEYLFTYSKTQIVKVKKNQTGSITTIYKLNDKGQIVSEQYGNDSYVTIFTYDVDGYLVESKYGSIDDANMLSTKYRYTNGNLTRVDYGNGSYIDYTYSTEIATNTGFAAKNYFYRARFTINSPLKNYFGKQSKNLVSKGRYYYGLYDTGDDAYAYVETNTYEKDAKRNIIKISSVSNQNYKYTVSSKYSCK